MSGRLGPLGSRVCQGPLVHATVLAVHAPAVAAPSAASARARQANVGVVPGAAEPRIETRWSALRTFTPSTSVIRSRKRRPADPAGPP